MNGSARHTSLRAARRRAAAIATGSQTKERTQDKIGALKNGLKRLQLVVPSAHSHSNLHAIHVGMVVETPLIRIENFRYFPKKGKPPKRPNIQNEFGVCGWILTILSYLLILVTLPISACMCIKVVQEYERAVIFRLGRLMPGGAKGPGIFFIIPCIDTYRKVDLRVLSFEVPPQEILSKDSVTVAVDAVVYFRISNATISVTNVEDAARSTKLLAQTTLRNILGTKTLAEMLSDREAISHQMQTTLDEATEPWGVKVERVEVKDVRLPVQLQRAMAAEAEAAREARAKVIVAEGEQKASRALKEAAEVIAESPSALQLRYLQTLNSISAEKNSTIIFPFPIDLLSAFLQRPTPKIESCVPSTMLPHSAKTHAC
ncbi:Mechanosensory protein 2 [Parelaphostrongylus tenuis]|uniref:Mechanosensory protein 2 n=1 Tax=Parelaphostrongylus tenuis TaxID=148309 RepID=A0AAD5QJR2_PARTN|nr:Mechanosensory protein 2 [Parelaphostrongylus tenuis]